MPEESITREYAAQDARLGELEKNMDEAALQSREFEADHHFRGFRKHAEKTIAESRHKAEAAHTAYSRGKQDLFLDDGTPMYSEAKHEEVLGDLKRRRSGSFEEINTDLREISAQIEGQLEEVSQPPRLTDAETRKANTRASFVREDVDHAPLDNVPRMLRAAELTGDRAEIWCAVRYTRMRADREVARLEEALNDPSTWDDPSQAERTSKAIQAIRDKAAALEDGLRLPGEKQRRGDLERLRDEAFATERHALERSITDEEREDRSTSVF